LSDELTFYYECPFSASSGFIDNETLGYENRSITISMTGIRYGDTSQPAITVDGVINVTRVNSIELDDINIQIENAENLRDTYNVLSILAMSIGGGATVFCAVMYVISLIATIGTAGTCSPFCVAACTTCTSFLLCAGIGLVGTGLALQAKAQEQRSVIEGLLYNIDGDRDIHDTTNKGQGLFIASVIVELVGIICAIITLNVKGAIVKAATTTASGLTAVDSLTELADPPLDDLLDDIELPEPELPLPEIPLPEPEII
jgi:hypothetical protein